MGKLPEGEIPLTHNGVNTSAVPMPCTYQQYAITNAAIVPTLCLTLGPRSYFSQRPGKCSVAYWKNRKHVHAFAADIRTHSSWILQQIMFTTICPTNPSHPWISVFSRSGGWTSQKCLLRAPLGVLARICSSMCWKDELTDTARNAGGEETRIKRRHLTWRCLHHCK